MYKDQKERRFNNPFYTALVSSQVKPPLGCPPQNYTITLLTSTVLKQPAYAHVPLATRGQHLMRNCSTIEEHERAWSGLGIGLGLGLGLGAVEEHERARQALDVTRSVGRVGTQLPPVGGRPG